MKVRQRDRSLEVAEDLGFQRAAWKVQRVGWVVMGLVIVAALAGLLGPGPLSSVQVGEAGGPFLLKYNRFIRFQAPTQLQFQIGTGAATDGAARLWVDRRYLEQVLVEQITPNPDSVEAAADRLIFAFRVPDGGRPTSVTFHLEAQSVWLQEARAGLVDGPSLAFWQFVYP